LAFQRDQTEDQGLHLPICVRSCDTEELPEGVRCIDLVELDEEHARITLLAGVRKSLPMPSTPPLSLLVPPASPERPVFPGSAITWQRLREICKDVTKRRMGSVQDKYLKVLYLQRDRVHQSFEQFLEDPEKRCFV